MVRHLRSFLYEAQVNMYGIYYRRRVWNNPLTLHKVDVDLKTNVDDIIFETEFLETKKYTDPEKIIENEMILTIKSFIWAMVNLSNKSNIDIEVYDKLITYHCKNSYSKVRIKLESYGDLFDANIEYDVRVTKRTKSYLMKKPIAKILL